MNPDEKPQKKNTLKGAKLNTRNNHADQLEHYTIDAGVNQDMCTIEEESKEHQQIRQMISPIFVDLPTHEIEDANSKMRVQSVLVENSNFDEDEALHEEQRRPSPQERGNVMIIENSPTHSNSQFMQ